MTIHLTKKLADKLKLAPPAAAGDIVLHNLAYNLSRYSTLRRLDRAKALA